MSYDDDREIETKFTADIKIILAKHFLRKDEAKDMTEGQDFAVYHLKPFSVGARLRRWKYYEKYRHQFTLRWKRLSGVFTEIDKVRMGKVNYILYGWLDYSGEKIIQYLLGDFRYFTDPEPIAIIQNTDPRASSMAAYNVSQFPPDFIKVYWNGAPHTRAPSIHPSLETHSQFMADAKRELLEVIA